jgi:hypothetical protein
LNAPFIKRRVGITEYDCKKPKFRNYGSKTSSITSITSNRFVSIDQISTESTAAQLEKTAEIQIKNLESTAEISNNSIKSESLKQQQQIKTEIQTSTLTSIENEKKNTIQAQAFQFVTKEESNLSSEEEIRNDLIKSKSIKQKQQQIKAEIQTRIQTSKETEKKPFAHISSISGIKL